MIIGLIWAQNERGIIGVDSTLPWHIPEDMAHFRNATRGKAVIMGRATWDSLPEAVRPLPGRKNIVLTRSQNWAAPGAIAVHTVEQALDAVDAQEVWIIGGGEVYHQCLPIAHRCLVTKVVLPAISETSTTAYAPELGPEWVLESSDPELGWHLSASGIQYRFESYGRINVNER